MLVSISVYCISCNLLDIQSDYTCEYSTHRYNISYLYIFHINDIDGGYLRKMV